jgi:hypothetical protein
MLRSPLSGVWPYWAMSWVQGHVLKVKGPHDRGTTAATGTNAEANRLDETMNEQHSSDR